MPRSSSWKRRSPRLCGCIQATDYKGLPQKSLRPLVDENRMPDTRWNLAGALDPCRKQSGQECLDCKQRGLGSQGANSLGRRPGLTKYNKGRAPIDLAVTHLPLFEL